MEVEQLTTRAKKELDELVRQYLNKGGVITKYPKDQRAINPSDYFGKNINKEKGE